jgi:hypothetical protein
MLIMCAMGLPLMIATFGIAIPMGIFMPVSTVRLHCWCVGMQRKGAPREACVG